MGLVWSGGPGFGSGPQIIFYMILYGKKYSTDVFGGWVNIVLLFSLIEVPEMYTVLITLFTDIL